MPPPHPTPGTGATSCSVGQAGFTSTTPAFPGQAAAQSQASEAQDIRGQGESTVKWLGRRRHGIREQGAQQKEQEFNRRKRRSLTGSVIWGGHAGDGSGVKLS